MTRWLTVLATGSADRRAVDAWLASTSHASRVLDDKAGEGDIIYHRAVADEHTLPPRMRVTEQIAVEPFAARFVASRGPRHLRTLLIRVRDGVEPQTVQQLESTLLAMPTHIPAIRSWSLARLARRSTDAGWTHLWEQEFDEPQRFRPYMGHPYHWTGVERWFDPEVPGHIVTGEAHYLSPIPGPVITEQKEG